MHGQSNLDNADGDRSGRRSCSRYEADRRKDLLLTARPHGIDEVMKAQAPRCAVIFRRRTAAASRRAPRIHRSSSLRDGARTTRRPRFRRLRSEARAVRRRLHGDWPAASPRLIALAYAFEQATEEAASRRPCFPSHEGT